MTNLINAEVLKLAPDHLIELYILDTNVIGGGSIDYFHAGTATNRWPIVFQGITYQPFPIEITGFDRTGQGTIPKPKASVSNVQGVISATALQFNDLVGAKFTRKRTFAKFLDGSPTADPTQEFPLDIYYVNQKLNENAQLVEFELTTSFDMIGLSLPSRQILQNSCPWVYKSAECSWVPVAGEYFDVNDVSQALIGGDVCGKRLTSCEARFGAVTLPFGGFPGARAYI
jgi:lambda family phage minor tail protein L